MAVNSNNRRLSSANALAYMGVTPLTPPNLIINTFEPTSDDYLNVSIGDIWLVIDPLISPEPTQEIWILGSIVGRQANWVKLYPGSGTGVTEMPTNNGIAVEANATINMFGQNLIHTVGSSNTVGIDLLNGTVGQLIIGGGTQPEWANLTSLDGTVAIANGTNSINLAVDDGIGTNQITTDSGNAVPSHGVIEISSTVLLNTVASGDTVTINLDRANNGQIPIAKTGGPTRYANITSNDGSVVITNGPNSIDLSVDLATGRSSFFYYQATDFTKGADPVFNNLGSRVVMTKLFDTNNDCYPGNGSGVGASFTAPVDGLYGIGLSVASNVAAADMFVQIVIPAQSRSKAIPVSNYISPFSSSNVQIRSAFYTFFLFETNVVNFLITRPGAQVVYGNNGSTYQTYFWGELISAYG